MEICSTVNLEIHKKIDMYRFEAYIDNKTTERIVPDMYRNRFKRFQW